VNGSSGGKVALADELLVNDDVLLDGIEKFIGKVEDAADEKDASVEAAAAEGKDAVSKASGARAE
jgi:hypothetical protein